MICSNTSVCSYSFQGQNILVILCLYAINLKNKDVMRQSSLSQAFSDYLSLTAIADQTNRKNNFESVAKQRLQNYSWFGFECKAL